MDQSKINNIELGQEINYSNTVYVYGSTINEYGDREVVDETYEFEMVVFAICETEILVHRRDTRKSEWLSKSTLLSRDFYIQSVPTFNGILPYLKR